MTTAFRPTNAIPSVPTMPNGWPIGSYDTYAEAQAAVDYLADARFPVHDVTIVGVEPLLVERVSGRLSWGRVLGTGAASGAWFGLFVGLLLSMFAPVAGFAFGPILVGLLTGTVFGLGFAALNYRATHGRRDFVSHSQIVARRYDILCQPRRAEDARALLARFAVGMPATTPTPAQA
jgi:heat induced stress protein YflT